MELPNTLDAHAPTSGNQMNHHSEIARCPGVGNDSEGWREGCEKCLRRGELDGGGGMEIEPPPIIVFECEFLIEDENG